MIRKGVCGLLTVILVILADSCNSRFAFLASPSVHCCKMLCPYMHTSARMPTDTVRCAESKRDVDGCGYRNETRVIGGILPPECGCCWIDTCVQGPSNPRCNEPHTTLGREIAWELQNLSLCVWKSAGPLVSCITIQWCCVRGILLSVHVLNFAQFDQVF